MLPSMEVTVTLTDDEVRRCASLAVERWTAKLESTDKESYAIGRKNGLLEHDLVNAVRANVTEWAVAKYYALPWNGGFTYPNSEHPRRKYLPDVGGNLEVRCRRTQDDFPMWDYDTKKDGIIVATEVVDDSTFQEVRIFGWLVMNECARPEWWYAPMKRYYIPVAEFNDPATLPV